MKLGKNVSIAIADIPDVYLNSFISVFDVIEKKQVEAMLSAKPEDLLSTQKSVQTLRVLKKAIRSAPEEAKLHNKRNT